ncbi:MAG: hypothetical protein OXF04_03615 [bacterium]|nr:hypothetical protein [bacterium]
MAAPIRQQSALGSAVRGLATVLWKQSALVSAVRELAPQRRLRGSEAKRTAATVL